MREYRRANPDKRIVLDTFSSHHAVVVGRYAAGNGIPAVHLSSHSPDRSPIEQIWRAIKREVSATFVTGYEYMIATIARVCKKLAAKRANWEKWVKTFLSPMYAAKMVSHKRESV